MELKAAAAPPLLERDKLDFLVLPTSCAAQTFPVLLALPSCQPKRDRQPAVSQLSPQRASPLCSAQASARDSRGRRLCSTNALPTQGPEWRTRSVPRGSCDSPSKATPVEKKIEEKQIDEKKIDEKKRQDPHAGDAFAVVLTSFLPSASVMASLPAVMALK